MNKKLLVSLIGALILSTSTAAPARANPGSEGVFDPCFAESSLTGLIYRYVSSGTNDFKYDDTSIYRTNVLIRKSGQLFRADNYRNYNYSNSEEVSNYEYHQIVYDLGAGTKTVKSTTGNYKYFSEYAYERLVGWLLDDQGNEVRRSSFTIRSNNYANDRSGLRKSSQTIARNCSGAGGSGTNPLPGQVNEIALEATTTGTYYVDAHSGTGTQKVSIQIESGTVAANSKLLIWNDPNSTENQMGFASLGFQVVDRDGNPVPLMKPIKVSYDSVTDGILAYSTDSKDWEWLKETTQIGSASISKLNSSSFVIESVGGAEWIFVGQKTEQKSPILYANQFRASVSSRILLTTTGGSGKGSVSISSTSPGICKIESKTLTGISQGNCTAVATKAGFDGYMDAKTQVIHLEIIG